MPRLLRSFALAALAVASTACADLATSPTAAATASVPSRPSLEVLSSPVIANGVLRSIALFDQSYSFDAVASATTTVTVPNTGLKISVPSGALPRGVKTMRITVTVKAGDMVAYDFQPHGTKFVKPITLTQDLRSTNYGSLANKAAVEGGYFTDLSLLDEALNTARVSEFLPVKVDATASTVSMAVSHFSGYMLSSGRQSEY